MWGIPCGSIGGASCVAGLSKTEITKLEDCALRMSDDFCKPFFREPDIDLSKADGDDDD